VVEEVPGRPQGPQRRRRGVPSNRDAPAPVHRKGVAKTTTPRPTPDLTHAQWFKATASGGNGDCLEAAFLPDGRVALRDNEDLDKAPFVVSAFVWEYFLDGAKKDEFDLPG
jgi:hypothetical protein